MLLVPWEVADDFEMWFEAAEWSVSYRFSFSYRIIYYW